MCQQHTIDGKQMQSCDSKGSHEKEKQKPKDVPFEPTDCLSVRTSISSFVRLSVRPSDNMVVGTLIYYHVATNT